MSIADVIKTLLQEFDNTIDVESHRFKKVVMEPIDEFVGEGLPSLDAVSLIKKRLTESDPSIDGTVFGDLFGKPLSTILAPLQYYIRSSISRRRLTSASVLSSGDLESLRDFFLVPTLVGSYSRGVVRVFYANPRSLFFDVTDSIVCNYNNSSKVYRPTKPHNFTVRDVRGSYINGSYYVDVELVASQAGGSYDVPTGAFNGASGFPGSTRVTNYTQFMGGNDSDTIPTYLARIRSAVTLRSLATVAGANYVLPELGVKDFKIVKGGDEEMLRDRIYGPATISGMPGGLTGRVQTVNGDGSFVSIGIAFDIWVKPPTANLVSATLSNIVNEGVLLMSGSDGSLQYTSSSKFTLSLPTSRLLEIVSPTETVFPKFPGELRPVKTSGTFMVFEGLISPISGRRRLLRVAYINESGTEVSLVDEDDLPPPDEGTFIGRHYSFFRRDDLHLNMQSIAIPLVYCKGLDSSTGEPLPFNGGNVLTLPGTTVAETSNGSYIERNFNVINTITDFPVLSVERVELLDPLSNNPTGDFIYPRNYIFAELLESTSGSEYERATKVRIHLLGPQASAVSPKITGYSLSSNSNHLMTVPSFTYSMNFVGAGPTTDSLQTLDPFESIWPSVTNRFVRPGDWLRATTSSGAVYNIPIESVDYTSLLIKVAAADMLVEEGEVNVEIFQGTSRSTLLAEGRSAEGTYSFDVWAIESTLEDYTPSNPPLTNTQVTIESESWLTQGFELVSPLPGQQFSSDEEISLVFTNRHVADNQEIEGRSCLLHLPSSNFVTALQNKLSPKFRREGEGLDSVQPMVSTGLAKTFSPTYVIWSVFYDALNLPTVEASEALRASFTALDNQGRVEQSDLINALYDAGADYVLGGRVFTLAQNYNRSWTCTASKGAIPVEDLSYIKLHSISVIRLKRREKGKTLDEMDSANWEGDPVFLRSGGFDAD